MVHTTRIAITLALLSLVSAAAVAEDWRMYRRDRVRSGVTSEQLAPPWLESRHRKHALARDRLRTEAE